jgi:hypothetical protein
MLNTIRVDCTGPSTDNLYAVSTATTVGAFFYYHVQDAIADSSRTGMIMATWFSTSTPVYTDTSTADPQGASTADVVFSVVISGSDAVLRATIGGTNEWVIRVGVVLIPYN